MNVGELADMTKEEVLAEFEHGFTMVAGDEGTVEAVDVADYILHTHGPMEKIRLQKTLYYCQAVALAILQRPLFGDPIEAWSKGPVVRDVRDRWRVAPGDPYLITEILGGDGGLLTAQERAAVDLTMAALADQGKWDLVRTSHKDDAWRKARQRAGAGPADRTDAVMSLDDIAGSFVPGLHELVAHLSDD